MEGLKSLWRDRSRGLWSFLCPLCKAQRKVLMRPRPGGVHFIQIGLTSVMFTLLFWSVLGWRGVVSFVPFWTLFEIVYRWRLRAVLPCRQCGFDPYLFLADVDSAKVEIETHWKKKFAEKGIPYPDTPSVQQKRSQQVPSISP